MQSTHCAPRRARNDANAAPRQPRAPPRAQELRLFLGVEFEARPLNLERELARTLLDVLAKRGFPWRVMT
jgi:hypothetical protein